MEDLLEQFDGKTTIANDALLFPSGYILRYFRRELLHRIPSIGGVQFFTPGTLLEELLLRQNLPLRTLPAEMLIPWQLDRGLSPACIGEIFRMRPKERDIFFPDAPLKTWETFGLYTPMGLAMKLAEVPPRIHWDRARIIGFSEGSWDSYPFMVALRNSADELHAYFEMAESTPRTLRWRRVWNYDLTPIPCHGCMGKEKFLEISVASCGTDVGKIVSGKVLAILGTASPNSDPSIAIAFRGNDRLHGLVRARLELLKIPFFDSIPVSPMQRIDPIWRPWLSYQRRQKREECLALLDGKFVAGQMDESEWEFLKFSIEEFTQKCISDHCGENLPDNLRKYLSPLPDPCPLDDAFEICRREFPFLENFVSQLEILKFAYESLPRDAFLQWLDAVTRRYFQRPTDRGSYAVHVHLIDYSCLPHCHFDHLICTVEDFSAGPEKNSSTPWAGEDLKVINDSMDDFYYGDDLPVPSGHNLPRQVFHWAKEVVIIGQGDWKNPGEFAVTSSLSPVRGPADLFRKLDAFFSPSVKLQHSADDPYFQSCIDAHAARRQLVEFGEYDFSVAKDSKFRETFLEAIPCTAWERTFFSPEEVWLTNILKMKKIAESAFDELPMVRGIFVHRLIAEVLEKQNLQREVFLSKEENFIFPQSLFPKKDCGYGLTESLERQIWGQVSTLLCCLRRQLADGQWEYADIEMPIRSFAANGAVSLWIHGRSDLVLRAGKSVRIVDFKTRSPSMAFTPLQFRRGHFLQMLLYAFYYSSLHYDVHIQILSPHCRPLGLDFPDRCDKSARWLWEFLDQFMALQRKLSFGYGDSEGREVPFITFSHGAIPADVVQVRRRLSGWDIMADGAGKECKDE
jgi:hypothetical protein